MGSDDIFQLLLTHHLASKIQRKFSRIFLTSDFPVVEVDIPWDEAQVAEYGPHFNPWGEKTFKKLIKSLVVNLGSVPFTLLVSDYMKSMDCFRSIIHAHNLYLSSDGWKRMV